MLARPYSWRLTGLSRVTCPLDHGSTMAARTVASSSPRPEVKDASSLPTSSRSEGVRSSVFLAATMVLNRSRRLRAAAISGEAVSPATLTPSALADLQSRYRVSRRVMVRVDGTFVRTPGFSGGASMVRRLPVVQ